MLYFFLNQLFYCIIDVFSVNIDLLIVSLSIYDLLITESLFNRSPFLLSQMIYNKKILGRKSSAHLTYLSLRDNTKYITLISYAKDTCLMMEVFSMSYVPSSDSLFFAAWTDATSTLAAC